MGALAYFPTALLLGKCVYLASLSLSDWNQGTCHGTDEKKRVCTYVLSFPKEMWQYMKRDNDRAYLWPEMCPKLVARDVGSHR